MDSDKVFSFEMARDWFDSHSAGEAVTCVKVAEDGVTHQGHQVCGNVAEAATYYGVAQAANPAEVASEAAKAVAVETPAVETTEAPVESPVSGVSAHDAIDQVSRMRSTDKLQEIVDHDQRTTVVDAAQARLEAQAAKSDTPAE